MDGPCNILEDRKKTSKSLVGKQKEKRPLENPRHRGNENRPITIIL
jgi:hypothetical protein